MRSGGVIYSSRLEGHEAELVVIDPVTATYRLTVDGIPQSEVNLVDPTVIVFDYARHIARVVDAVVPPGRAITCAHLGGGALTLARYVAVTRPGSTQFVVESEEKLTTDLLGVLPLPEGSDVGFLFGDARAVMEGSPAEHRRTGSPWRTGETGVIDAHRRSSAPWRKADVTIVDLWEAATIPARVASLEFYRLLAPLIAPTGVMAVNVLDGHRFDYARRQAATLSALFEHVVVTMDRRMIDGSVMGNVLLFASPDSLAHLDEPGWPVGDANAPCVLSGEALFAWIGTATPMTDRDATDSPPPDRD